MPDHAYPELARKLAAATTSHISGFKSIDLFLRNKVPAEVAPIWHDFAAHIMGKLFPMSDKPERLM